jgi:hypothetical protein
MSAQVLLRWLNHHPLVAAVKFNHQRWRTHMGKLRITLACWDYDRTSALANGTVVADGLDINYLSLPVEETFFRMLRNKEFECAEMSLSLIHI